MAKCKPPGGHRKRNITSDALQRSVEDQHDRVLTERQREFARLYVEGARTNKECARLAGYSPDSCSQHASKLLDGTTYPHVVDYINELREERERRYGVTLIGQLQRLHSLSKGAEEAGQFSAAINAEKIRSALGGLTIDRRENINTMDQLSRDEIVSRLALLQKKYPQAFIIDGTATEIRDVTRSRGKLLDVSPADHAEDSTGHED